jgi:hypothetical protein
MMIKMMMMMIFVIITEEASGNVVAEALCYKLEGCGFETRSGE